MKDLPNWVLPAAAVVGGLFIWNRVKGIGAGAQKLATETGEKISASVFDFLNPELRPENYNKPTAIPAQLKNGAYVCPIGYRYKKLDPNRPASAKAQYPGEHWCFRED